MNPVLKEYGIRLLGVFLGVLILHEPIILYLFGDPNISEAWLPTVRVMWYMIYLLWLGVGLLTVTFVRIKTRFPWYAWILTGLFAPVMFFVLWSKDKAMERRENTSG